MLYPISFVTGENIGERCNRAESEDSHEAGHKEGSDAASLAFGAEEERQPPASPSSSQEKDEKRSVCWEIKEGVVHITPLDKEIEAERKHRQDHWDEYLRLQLGDEGKVC